jgi:signal transduction histidine kinase
MPTPHEAEAARRGASSGTDVDVVCPPIGPGGRWIAYAHGLFYGSVPVAAAVALAEAGRVQIATQIGISALVVAWYSYWIARRGRAVASSTAFGARYFGVLGLLWLILLASHPTYELLFPTVFAQMLGHLHWRGAISGSVVASILVHVPASIRNGRVDPGHLLFALVGLGILILIIVSLRAITDQSTRRQRLVESLESTREELAHMERRAGTLAERQRLASDIHDTVAQVLTSIITLLEAARVAMKSGSPRAADHVELALQAARDGLGETRRVVWALRPESLERGTLGDAIGRVVSRLARETGMIARAVVIGQARPLAAEVEVAVLRAAQEALANVRRHARARQVVVTLSYMDDVVLLDVCDDGVGFDPTAQQLDATRAGLGLVGMRERVEVLQGSLTMESSPGQGCTLRLELPTRVDAPAEVPERVIAQP